MQIEIGSGSTSRLGGRSAGGKGCLTLFFLVFFLMGAAFTIIIIGEAIRETAVWFWPETECTVISSGVEETGDESDPYQPVVVFEYRVDGRSYEGRKVTRGPTTSSSYDKARAPSDRYPPGSHTTCRVNPDIPGDAVLERKPPWIGLVIFFPLIFVAVGGGGIYAVWKSAPEHGSSAQTESISQRARSGKGLGRKITLGVGLLFTAVGGGLSVFLLILPAARLASALSWAEHPATIQASTVRSWSTDDGTSYRADVLYLYTIEGRSWTSNRRSFLPMASGSYDGAKDIVDRHQAGTSTTCFVDSENPTRSVLDRSFQLEYLIGLFPLVFLLAGLGLTIYSLRSRHQTASDSPIPERHAETNAVQLDLEPDAGPVAKIAGMLIFASIWNGIISIFIWQAIQGFLSGDPEWVLTIFLIPFVVIGLALIVGVFYTILASFNPRPRLTISPGAPRLGTRLRAEWSFRGKASRIHHLRIVLEGHEKATYRRGTDTHTDREAFISLDLVDTSAEWEIARGSVDVEIPEDTMHSFSAANNAVVWSLHLQGEIARWPDVSETFDIEVLPLARERLLPR